MKKQLNTLALLLIYSTAVAQMPDHIESELTEIEQSIETLGEYYVSSEIAGSSGAFVSENINEFTRQGWSGLVDFEYYLEGQPAPWEHSVNAAAERVRIGITKKGLWHVWAARGGRHNETVTVRNDEEPKEYTCKFHGFWDSRYTPEDAPVNLYRSYLNHDSQEGIDRGNRLAILLNDFTPSDSDEVIRKRLQNWKQHLTNEIAQKTEFIILEDEPRHKGFSVQQLERMVEIAKEELGDYIYTFSFMRYHAWKADIPTNLEVVWINFYPFYRKDYCPKMYTATQEKFNDVLSSTVNSVRKKMQDVKIMLTGQAFYDDNYRKPPAEAPLWYEEFIQNHDYMLGVMWYQWRDYRGTGTQSMPELYRNQQEVFEQVCPKSEFVN